MSAGVLYMIDFIERSREDVLELPSGEKISAAEARALLKLAIERQNAQRIAPETSESVGCSPPALSQCPGLPPLPREAQEGGILSYLEPANSGTSHESGQSAVSGSDGMGLRIGAASCPPVDVLTSREGAKEDALRIGTTASLPPAGAQEGGNSSFVSARTKDQRVVEAHTAVLSPEPHRARDDDRHGAVEAQTKPGARIGDHAHFADSDAALARDRELADAMRRAAEEGIQWDV